MAKIYKVAGKSNPHFYGGTKKGEKQMKTKVLLAASLLVAGFAVSAQAGIVGSKHDLSNTNSANTSIHSQTQNQTCVFCHAPHNAITNKLLWNRNYLAGSTIKIYTSYNTTAMKTAMKTSTAANQTLGDDSSSLLCLSCHSISTVNVDQVITSTANTKGGTPHALSGSWGSTTGNMTNLTNDHPVGISYSDAITPSNGGLQPVASIKAAGLRLFASNNGGADTMECASCHSVHDNTNGKFLAIDNTSSNLCITCHIK